jgi:N-acetylmuramoyl-L-alanine amidase
MKIAIDAGHGGDDTGAEGPNGLTESSVVLDLSELLSDRLKELRMETKLTRDSDVFVTLNDRCLIANNWEADYFISIHCNSDGSTAVGIETLYASDLGEELAAPIQKALITATGDVDRGLKHRSDLYVLNATSMPAILAEVGFISHPATEEKLDTDEYRDIIVEAIVEGLCRFLDHREQIPLA